MSKSQMMEMSWYEFRDAMAMNDLVIIPVGAIEAHGVHGPLGTDRIIANELAKKIGEEAGVPVAPTIPFGVSRNIGAFPGTLEMDPNLLRRLLVNIMESYYRHGAKRFLVINGHGGNSNSIYMACCDMHTAHENVIAVQSEWWKTVPQISKYPCNDHAGKYETSVVLAIDETLCNMELARTVQRKNLTDEITFDYAGHFKGARMTNAGGMPLSALSCYGNFGAPAEEADAKIGEEIIRIYVEYGVKLVKELKRVYL